MAFKMRYGRQGPPMYDKSFATKYSHDEGLSKYSDTHMSKTIAKPDYLDFDGDGDEKETMKKALKTAASSGEKEAFTEKVSKTIKEQTPNVTSNLKKTPYEKNKYSSHMPKHGSGRTISNADKKRMDVLIEKLNKMSDPIESNQGKATLKAIKKIDPNFDAETYM
tara:strand:+ start:1995 stop:2489 length:495 start_codon:yes stop_codon:yes gene_type:complete